MPRLQFDFSVSESNDTYIKCIVAASNVQKDEELAQTHPYTDIDFDGARERNYTVPGYLVDFIPNESAQCNEQ